MTGLMDFFGMGGAAGAGAAGGGGGLIDWLTKPMPADPNAGSAGLNKLGMIGAMLQDFGANQEGRRGGALNEFQGRQSAAAGQQARAALHQRIQDAYASGDMNKVRQVLIEAEGAGEDTGHIMNAMQFGAPKVQDIGGAGYAIDPMGAKAPTQVIAPAAKRPLIAGGLQSLDNGQTWAPIPGYADQQSLLATGRRRPAAAAAPAAHAVLTPPWQLYGGK